jgi:hypothetical protein
MWTASIYPNVALTTHLALDTAACDVFLLLNQGAADGATIIQAQVPELAKVKQFLERA